MNKLEDVLELIKWSELKKNQEKKNNALLITLSVIGAVVVVGATAYAVYKYVMAKKEESEALDFYDEFDDSFDDDCIELDFDYENEDEDEDNDDVEVEFEILEEAVEATEEKEEV
ncbi:MAG: hypothetical protein R3Y47_08445 [Lachnospiraceae bacterium]